MQTKKKKENPNIIVIGELIIDEHTYSKMIGTSLETPTLKSQFRSKKITMGGAGKVFTALQGINKNNYFITILGSDKKKIRFSYDKKIIKFFHKGKSIIKKRYWIDNYKILQINSDNNRTILNIKNIQKKILRILEKYKKCKAIIISDYMHGMFDPFFTKQIINFAKINNIVTYVDQQASKNNSNLYLYKGFDYLIINENELNIFFSNNDELKKNIKKLNMLLEIPNIVIKLSSKGCIGFHNNKFYRVAAYKKIYQPLDTSGAGDYFLAKFVSSKQKNFNKRLLESNKFSYEYISNYF